MKIQFVRNYFKEKKIGEKMFDITVELYTHKIDGEGW